MKKSRWPQSPYAAPGLLPGRVYYAADIIEAAVCSAAHITYVKLCKGPKNTRAVQARAALYYYLYHYANMSLIEVGKRLCKDHTTVLYGKGTYTHMLTYQEDIIALNTRILNKLDEIQQSLQKLTTDEDNNTDEGGRTG